MPVRRLLSCAAATALAAALVGVVQQPAAAESQSIVTIHSTYGVLADETMTTYAPVGSGSHPAILFVHGGAWGRAEPNGGELAEGRQLAERTGWVVAVIGYPTQTAPERRVEPDAILAALDKLASRADVDRSRIALWGESAGGQLALLTAYRDSLRSHPLVAAVVSVSGPTDMSVEYDGSNPLDPYAVTHFEGIGLVQALLDGLLRYRTTSPADLVTRRTTPTFQAISRHDPLVSPRQIAELARRLANHDVRHVTRYVAGSDHSYPIEFERPPGAHADVQTLALRFVSSVFTSS